MAQTSLVCQSLGVATTIPHCGIVVGRSRRGYHCADHQRQPTYADSVMTAPAANECGLVFVYGTLRRGFSRHNVLRRLSARYVGRGTIQAELFDLGDFPGARKSQKAKARVAGEIYRLGNPMADLKVLDEVEDFRVESPESSLFWREPTPVVLTNGKQATAWVYWLNQLRGPMRPIRSGQYTPC